MSMALIAASTVAHELQAEVNRLREQVVSLTAERDKMREGLTMAEARLLFHVENAPQQRWHVAERKWIDASGAPEDRICLAKVREAMGTGSKPDV